MPPINCACKFADRVIVKFTLVLLAWLVAAPLAAQERPMANPLSSNEKIHITADTLEANNKDRSFVFKGQVKVVQGTTTINSDTLLIRYRPDSDRPAADPPSENNRIEKIEATGHVVILFDGRTAKSEKAVYLSDQETLQLIGENSTIIDGPSTIVGSKITLYRNEDRIKVESSKQNRVTAIIFPEKKNTD
jgi:lipopolysaccharide export system protein LptA